MKTVFKSLILLTGLVFVTACSLQDPDITSTSLSTGDADFSRFVSIGNSLTAGYQSGALTQEHQKYSFPKYIATQAGVTEFNQPLLTWPGIGTYTTSGAGILKLYALDDPTTPGDTPDPIIAPVPYPSDYNFSFPYASLEVGGLAKPYNNLGVPGAALVDVLNATDAASSATHTNSFFDIVLRNPNFGGTSQYQQARMLQPTFMTVWIGNNDVLGYATSGGTSPEAPTPVDAFTFLFGQMLDSLMTTGADMVVANIPNVTAIPFMTTIPYAIDPGIGVAVPLVIQATDGIRQATAEDLILLTAKSLIGDTSGTYGPAGVPVGFNAAAPLPTSVVLDKDEVAIAQQAVADFNNAIASLASARGIAVVDVNSFFNDLKANGLPIAGLEFTADFLTGGLFSLDGVHPSDLGYAIIANEFIKTINEKFNATIPFVNIVEVMNELSPTVLNGNAKFDENAFNNVVGLFSGSTPQK